MPILRYFLFVGGALLALLFAANLTIFETPVTQAAPASVAAVSDQPMVRIRSDRKLPERVVFDTNQPAIAAPVAKTADATAAKAHADTSAKARVRDTFAQFVPEPRNAGPSKVAEANALDVKAVEANKVAEAKPVAAAPAQPKRKVARSHSAPQYGYYGPQYGRPMLVAQQPHFGMFGNTW